MTVTAEPELRDIAVAPAPDSAAGPGEASRAATRAAATSAATDLDARESCAAADVALLAAAREGDPTAFSRLYEAHVELATRYARRFTNRSEDAADCCADTFLSIFSALRNGHGPREGFHAYLFTVLRRKAFDLASAARGSTLIEELPESSAPMFLALEAHDQVVENEPLRRAFSSLSAEYQELLWLTEVHGYTPASLTDSSRAANTLAALLYRARRQLRINYLAALEALQPRGARSAR